MRGGEQSKVWGSPLYNALHKTKVGIPCVNAYINVVVSVGKNVSEVGTLKDDHFVALLLKF